MKCKDGCFYVGVTEQDIQAVIKRALERSGPSKFVKEHGYLGIDYMDSRPEAFAADRRLRELVISYKSRFGVEKVAGGPYSTRSNPKDRKAAKTAERKLRRILKTIPKRLAA